MLNIRTIFADHDPQTQKVLEELLALEDVLESAYKEHDTERPDDDAEPPTLRNPS